MAARNRYTSDIECTNCGQKGVLHISEDDHPYMTSLFREIDKVDGEFQAKLTAGVDISIICSKCNYNFSY